MSMDQVEEIADEIYNKSLAEALDTVVTTLQSLSEADKKRILRTAAAFFGLTEL